MIVVISGTNRRGARSLAVANILADSYRSAGSEVRLLDLAQMPPEIFSPDIYKGDKPAAFVDGFIQPVLNASGLHVVVPEYNGSFPGALKYFIDLLPFPEAFEAKPVAYLGLAAGMFGAMRAVEQLQMVFGYRNAHNYPRRIFIPSVYSVMDEGGAITDPDLQKRISAQVGGFQEFVDTLSASRK